MVSEVVAYVVSQIEIGQKDRLWYGVNQISPQEVVVGFELEREKKADQPNLPSPGRINLPGQTGIIKSMNVKKMVFEKLKTLTNQKFDTNSEVLAIGIDSLDLVELITDVEEQLKIAISDQELESIKTIEDIITTIEKKLPSRK